MDAPRQSSSSDHGTGGDARTPSRRVGHPIERKRYRKLQRDARTLARFIRVFCDGHHAGAERAPLKLPTDELRALCPRPPRLCTACNKLLLHALVKRARCPFDPKPACKHCPRHCYQPHYRRQIRQVMSYSGRRLVMTGRLHYLLHLWR